LCVLLLWIFGCADCWSCGCWYHWCDCVRLVRSCGEREEYNKKNTNTTCGVDDFFPAGGGALLEDTCFDCCSPPDNRGVENTWILASVCPTDGVCVIFKEGVLRREIIVAPLKKLGGSQEWCLALPRMIYISPC